MEIVVVFPFQGGIIFFLAPWPEALWVSRTGPVSVFTLAAELVVS
jgi:hypothetical protein